MDVMINKYELPMIIFPNSRWGEDLFPLFYGYKKALHSHEQRAQ